MQNFSTLALKIVSDYGFKDPKIGKISHQASGTNQYMIFMINTTLEPSGQKNLLQLVKRLILNS